VTGAAEAPHADIVTRRDRARLFMWLEEASVAHSTIIRKIGAEQNWT
jgi:hypothetical protein